MVFDALNASLVAQDAISGSLRRIANAAEEAGSSALAAGGEFGSFGAALDQVDQEAIETAVGNRQVANAVDAVGEEATESAAQLGALRGSLAGLGDEQIGDLDADLDISGIEEARSRLARLDAIEVDPTADVDLTGFQSALESLRFLDETEATPDVDLGDEALGRVARSQLEQIGGIEVHPEADLDLTGLAEARAALQNLDETEVNFLGRAATGGATEAFQSIGESAADSKTRVQGLRTALGSIGDADIGGSVSGIRDSLRSLGRTNVGEQVRSDLEKIPGLALQASESLDVLQLRIDEATDEARSFAGALNSLEGDERDAAMTAIEASESIEELQLRLRRIGGQAERAGDQLGDLGDSASSLVDDAVASASGIRTLRASIDEAGDEASSAARQIDDLGDEAIETAGQGQLLDAAMGDLGDTSVSLTGSLGPLRGRIGAIGQVAGAAAPAIFGLGSALGGLGVAAGAAGAGLAAIAFGGLQRKAEQMAATSSKLADSGEAMQKIFKEWGKAMKQATEPLQTVANTEFVFAGMEGAIELTRMFSESVADLAPTIRGLASAFGSRVMENAPAIFAEMETTVRALAPIFRDWLSVIDEIPAAIAFLRSEAVQLAPALGGFAGSAIHAGAAIADLGSDILTFALPALSVLLDVIGFVADTAASLPAPLQAAGLAAIAAAGAYSIYSGTALAATIATEGLIGALFTLTLPISGTAALIAGLVAAVAGVITYFGWWDDILNILVGTWNTVIGAIEWAINTVLALYDALGFLGPILFPGIAILTHLGDIINWLGGVFEWLAGIAADIFGAIMDIFEAVANAVENTIGVIDAVTNAVGLDSAVKGMDMKSEVDLGELQVDTGGGPAAKGAPEGPKQGKKKPKVPEVRERRRRRRKEQGDRTTYDFSGADFSGTDPSATKNAVKEAVLEANREQRAREDGRAE